MNEKSACPEEMVNGGSEAGDNDPEKRFLVDSPVLTNTTGSPTLLRATGVMEVRTQMYFSFPPEKSSGQVRSGQVVEWETKEPDRM